jgi:hypothetical protein
VASECEGVLYADNVLRILLVGVAQRLQDLDLYLALLVELLPVFQNLKRYDLFAFVIEASNHNAKRALAELLLYFISVIYLFFWFIQVIGLIIVEAMIVDCILVGVGARVLVLTIYFTFYKLSNSLMLGIQI